MKDFDEVLAALTMTADGKPKIKTSRTKIIRVGRKEKAPSSKSKACRPVISPDGVFYESLTEAAKAEKVSTPTIYGRLKRGIWKYA